MRTGDLGFIYDGGLYFVGRLKNMLKIRGRSLYAEDVEALVMGATQSSVTARCAVFAVNEEVDRDLIVLIESNKEGDDIAQRKVSLVASQICEAFGVAPQLVRIVAKNSLPVTTSGKLRRSKCREFFLAGLYG
jgi:acyl-CoA synthetase (AMP-forming)/AMP-acid ligase II